MRNALIYLTKQFGLKSISREWTTKVFKLTSRETVNMCFRKTGLMSVSKNNWRS